MLLGYGVPGDTIVPPVSVAGARWEPTGDGQSAVGHPGREPAPGRRGLRRLPTATASARCRQARSTRAGRSNSATTCARSEQTSVDAAPFVSEWLAQIGIKPRSGRDLGKLGDIINEGTYDLFSWGWYPDPDPSAELDVFMCDERPPDGKTYGNNDPYYCNPQYDELYSAAAQRLDPNARWEIVHEMQKMFYEDCAVRDHVVRTRSSRRTGPTGSRATARSRSPRATSLQGYGGTSAVWTELAR